MLPLRKIMQWERQDTISTRVKILHSILESIPKINMEVVWGLLTSLDPFFEGPPILRKEEKHLRDSL